MWVEFTTVPTMAGGEKGNTKLIKYICGNVLGLMGRAILLEVNK